MATQRQHTIRGKVVHVNTEKRFAFVDPLDAVLPEGVRTSDRGGFFMPLSVIDVVPAKGDEGTFVIVPGGERGWKIHSVVQLDDVANKTTSAGSDPAALALASFIHPYNFVRFPGRKAMHQALTIAPFARERVAPHDRYDNALQTGYIDCELTTLTDWFIPDPRKRHTRGEHATLGYFTLDPVDANTWREQPPATDDTQPAIPGSSLRGMVRSVFETATLSCLSVFDPGHLDFRLGRDLEDTYGTRIPAGRGKPRYVPCRIERIDGREVTIQLLDARRGDDVSDRERPTVVRMALIHAYERNVRYREVTGKATRIWSDLVTLPDGNQWKGNRVAAVIDATPRKLKGKHRFRVREVLAVVRADQDTLEVASVELLKRTIGDPPKPAGDASDSVPRQPHVVFGYLHRTGPNIENKHHERVFFRWADYNQIGAEGTIADRFQRFLEDQADWSAQKDTPGVYRSIDRELFNESLQRLREYAERQPGRDANSLERDGCHPPRMIHDARVVGKADLPYPSDFVRADAKKIVWREGDTCYALLEGDEPDATIHGLFPVAIPRLRHEDSRGDLLPFDLYPCSAKHRQCPDCRDASQHVSGGFCKKCFNRQLHLCPACRTFGWVRDLSGTTTSPLSNRVDAWAGHVRFTHGVYKSGDCPTQPVPLAILGSPKATTTMFYLRPETDLAKQKEMRWPPALQTLGQPLYRRSEAQLRGRKVYRRRLHSSANLDDPRTAGLRRKNGARDSQNQTVFILPKDLTFSFRVYFDALTRQELGALLFALSLRVPESWREKVPADAQVSHSLGHGKPLGMGGCSIRVQTVALDNLDTSDRLSRYRCWTSQPSPVEPQVFINAFGEAWQLAENAAPELQATRADLLEMLRCDWPDAANYPVHYPPNPDGKFEENYRWFMENVRPRSQRHQGGRFKELPAPELERNDVSERLPINPRNPAD